MIASPKTVPPTKYQPNEFRFHPVLLGLLRGARRIDFATFRKALGEVAKKWNSMTQEQVAWISGLQNLWHPGP